MNEVVTVSAPGKIILHGEHSVVYGKSAIACSLNTRTYISLRQTSDNKVSVILPDIKVKKSWSIDEMKRIPFTNDGNVLDPKPLNDKQMTVLQEFFNKGNSGVETDDLAVIEFLYIYLSIFKPRNFLSVEVKVKTELPPGSGLGSSAAYAVCLSAALLLLSGIIQKPAGNGWKSEDLDLINKWAFIGEILIHGKPSGIDNSIATYGKAMKFKEGNIHRLDKMPSLRILLVNTKIPRRTKDLVSGVRKKYEQYENIVKPVLDSMEAIVTKSEDILATMKGVDCDIFSSYRTLQELIDMNQNLLKFLGVSHPSLENVCDICQRYRLHCKLTGAGGGGCAFCLIPPEFNEDHLKCIQMELNNNNFDCWETSVGGNGIMVHDLNNCDNSTVPEFLLN